MLWGLPQLCSLWKAHQSYWSAHSSLSESRTLQLPVHTCYSSGHSHLYNENLCPQLASYHPVPLRSLPKSHLATQGHPRGHRCSYHIDHKCCWNKSWGGRWRRSAIRHRSPKDQSLFPKRQQRQIGIPWQRLVEVEQGESLSSHPPVTTETQSERHWERLYCLWPARTI